MVKKKRREQIVNCCGITTEKKSKKDESFKRFQSQDHGQGHQNEHDHVCHTYVYRHAKFECHILSEIFLQMKKIVKFGTQL